jgi:hypothetical protein
MTGIRKEPERRYVMYSVTQHNSRWNREERQAQPENGYPSTLSRES